MTPNPFIRKAISLSGLALIRRHESFSPVIYLCPAGKPTIGYGHVVRDTDRFPARLSPAQGEALLREDLAPTEIYLNAIFPDLTQNQFDALASFIFNVGLGNFENSTLVRRLKAGDIPGAASQFPRWVHGGGRILPGLVKRREAERQLFLQEASK